MITTFAKGTVLLFFSIWGCTLTQTSTAKKELVPIAINIQTEKYYELESVNWDVYKINLIRSLKQNQNVDLRLVDPGENPEIVLDVKIENFNISPNSERKRRQIYTRRIEIGVDSKGKPIYQTVSAAVDYSHSEIRSHANFQTTLKEGNQDIFSKRFSADYSYRNTAVERVSGDQRAVDVPVQVGTVYQTPAADTFLWSLSQQDMIRIISQELRDNLGKKN